MGLVARLSRIVPLLLVMALVAAVIYIVVSYRRSPTRAKEILVKIFTWFCSIVAVFFGLVSLYALFESNTGVLDLAVSFAVVGLIGLGIARWCNHVLVKHNPHYGDKPQQAKVIRRWPWDAWTKKK